MRLSNISVEQGFPGHLLGLLEAEHFEEGGGDVGEDAVVEGVGGCVVGDIDDFDEIGGVGGVGGAVLVFHEFAVSVVCGDEELAAEAEGLLDDGFYGGIDGLDGTLCCIDDTRVADHIGIGEVEDDEVEFLEITDDGVGDFIGRHLWLEVVGGDVFG